MFDKYLGHLPEETRDLVRKAIKWWIAGIVIGFFGFLAYEIAPAYMKNYELEDAAKHIAQLSVTNIHSASAIHEEVLQKARQIGVSVKNEDIVVNASAKDTPVATVGALLGEEDPPSQSIGSVAIDVSYAVPIYLPGFTWQLHFHIRADDHSV